MTCKENDARLREVPWAVFHPSGRVASANSFAALYKLMSKNEAYEEQGNALFDLFAELRMMKYMGVPIENYQ